MGWRPHSEHVGQTGKPVASNLYIAVGVSELFSTWRNQFLKSKSGYQQRSRSAFFKAADYGIIGDAFEVVPQLIEKLKAFKAQV